MIINVKTTEECPLRRPSALKDVRYHCSPVMTGIVCEGEDLPPRCPLHSRLVIVEKEGANGSPKITP